MATVVAGCYERFLFGFDVGDAGDDATAPPTLRRSFYLPVHAGPVKCVAAAAPFVATGGADDTVHLFDVANHADLGFLMSPGDGAVTALALYAPTDAAGGARPPPTHMLSGAADGSVTVWSAGKDWAELKTLTDHAAAVTALTVHDSGRVFLSTDAGGGLRLWSLVKGKAQFKTKLPAPADAALFAPPPAGDTYAIVTGDSVSVHSVEGGGVVTMGGAGRQLCAAWLDAHTLLTGGDKGALALWDARAGTTPVALLHSAHGARVKGVAAVPGAAAAAVAASAGGDGFVRLWDWRAASSTPASTSPLASAGASGARLTCATAVAAVAPSRAGTKLTQQQKSRRAKREAAAAAAANPPPPPAPEPARAEVKVPNAKARRKLLRAQVKEGRKGGAGGEGGAPPPPPPPPAAEKKKKEGGAKAAKKRKA